MTGKLSKNFHGVGIGPLSKILPVKIVNEHVKQEMATRVKGVKSLTRVQLTYFTRQEV